MPPKSVEKILNPTNPKQSNRQMRPIKTNLSNLKNQMNQKKLSENETDNFFTDLSYPTGSLNKFLPKIISLFQLIQEMSMNFFVSIDHPPCTRKLLKNLNDGNGLFQPCFIQFHVT